MDELKQKVSFLEQEITELKKSLLKLPLDPAALGAINQAYISAYFEQFNVRRLLLTKDTVNPVKEGEIVYHATTPSLKVLLNGVVKTITVS